MGHIVGRRRDGTVRAVLDWKEIGEGKETKEFASVEEFKAYCKEKIAKSRNAAT